MRNCSEWNGFCGSIWRYYYSDKNSKTVKGFNPENSVVMVNLWKLYQKKFSYAAEQSWNEIMKSVRDLYVL